jgi:hypothetical protein
MLITTSHKKSAASNTARTWQLPGIILFCTLLVACGGGGGADSSGQAPIGSQAIPISPPPPPPPPPVAVATVPVGIPALIFEVSEDASQFNNIIGDVIEGFRQNFVQFVPATGEATVIASNRSVSYAESVSSVKVFDDQIYVLNVSETGARVQKLDPDLLFESPASMPIPKLRNFDSVSDSCFAVIGNDLYFKVAHRDAVGLATGYEDGPLVTIEGFFDAVGKTQVTELIAGISGQTSPSSGGFVTDACRGYFDSDSGVWYDTEVGFANGLLGFFEKDRSSGEPISIASIVDQDPLMLSNLAFDDGIAYVAALDVAAQDIVLISIDLATLSESQLAIAAVSSGVDNLSASDIRFLDADDGYVSFVIDGEDRDVAVLYEPVSGTLEYFDFDIRINGSQIIFRGN